VTGGGQRRQPQEVWQPQWEWQPQLCGRQKQSQAEMFWARTPGAQLHIRLSSCILW